MTAMMKHYDPLKQPNTEEWLALDEQERIWLVEQYHKKAGVLLPNRHLHAAMHAVVENQLAEAIPVVRETLSRLMADGLDRHDALHAIATVLAGHMANLMRDGLGAGDPNERYYQALRTFTVADWFNTAP
jgi:hypothetical protein